MEEADLAAGIARRLLEGGAAVKDIAVMIPDAGYAPGLLAASFDIAGIPLAGAPEPTLRDSNAELIWLVVQSMRKTPPPMVLAALALSPLTPWSDTQGRSLARAIMDRGNGKCLPDYLQEVCGSGPRSHKTLMGRLVGLSQQIEALKPLIDRVAVLAPDDDTAPLDWGELLRELGAVGGGRQKLVSATSRRLASGRAMQSRGAEQSIWW